LPVNYKFFKFNKLKISLKYSFIPEESTGWTSRLGIGLQNEFHPLNRLVFRGKWLLRTSQEIDLASVSALSSPPEACSCYSTTGTAVTWVTATLDPPVYENYGKLGQENYNE